MKKVLIYPVLFTLLLGFGSYSQATVSEETIEMMSEEYREVECVLQPVPLSFTRHRDQNRQQTPFKSIEHVHGSRPHQAINDTSPSTSPNWSGYAALTKLQDPLNYSVEKVSGSWIVPTLTATPDDAFSVAFVGIDGFFNNETAVTIEQIGTAHIWFEGEPFYFAWFEMFGPTSTGGLNEIVNFPVNPGDEIFAQVKYVGNNIFSLKIFNTTQKAFVKVPYSLTFQPLAARTSAEWIVEAPSGINSILPLANYGTLEFCNCQAVIRDKKGSISNKRWENTAITMVNNTGEIQSQPSPLNCSGTNFTLTWVSE